MWPRYLVTLILLTTGCIKTQQYMSKVIYYLPGHGGRLDSALGTELMARGFDIAGRTTHGEFKLLSFSDQVKTIANDLESGFWYKDSVVIANSFGAYLFLHAQALLPPFIGKVLLLSPIVGEFTNDEKMMSFIPPKSDEIRSLINSGNYPTPLNIEMHVGSEDWQSNPQNVEAVANQLQVKYSIVPGDGHSLSKSYVGSVLDKWLGSPK